MTAISDAMKRAGMKPYLSALYARASELLSRTGTPPRPEMALGALERLVAKEGDLRRALCLQFLESVASDMETAPAGSHVTHDTHYLGAPAPVPAAGHVGSDTHVPAAGGGTTQHETAAAGQEVVDTQEVVASSGGSDDDGQNLRDTHPRLAGVVHPLLDPTETAAAGHRVDDTHGQLASGGGQAGAVQSSRDTQHSAVSTGPQFDRSPYVKSGPTSGSRKPQVTQNPISEERRANIRKAGHSSVPTIFDTYRLANGRQIGDVNTSEYRNLAAQNLRFSSLFLKLDDYARKHNKTGPGVLTRQLMPAKQLERIIAESGVINLERPTKRGILLESDGQLSYIQQR